MNIQNYIKPEYTFREIIDLQKLPLEVKEQITVEVLKQGETADKCDSSEHCVGRCENCNRRGRDA